MPATSVSSGSILRLSNKISCLWFSFFPKLVFCPLQSHVLVYSVRGLSWCGQPDILQTRERGSIICDLVWTSFMGIPFYFKMTTYFKIALNLKK